MQAGRAARGAFPNPNIPILPIEEPPKPRQPPPIPKDIAPENYDDLNLSDEQINRIEELALTTHNRPLPPTPRSEPSSAPRSLTRSPSIKKLNGIIEKLVSPGSALGTGTAMKPKAPTSRSIKEKKAEKREKKEGTNGLSISKIFQSRSKTPRALPDFQTLLPSSSKSELSSNQELKTDLEKFETLQKEIAENKASWEQMHTLLQQFDGQGTLLPLLPQICPLINNQERFDYLLRKSAETTAKDIPFRGPTVGLTIFRYLLMPEFEKAIGKWTFAEIAYGLICTKMPLVKMPETPKEKPLPSPDEKLIKDLHDSFLQRIAAEIETCIGKNAFIQERMRFLLNLFREQNYLLISPEKLVLSIFMLRFVTPVIAQMPPMLGEDDPVKREIGNYFRVLGRYLQKKTNSLATENLPLTGDLQRIFKAILP